MPNSFLQIFSKGFYKKYTKSLLLFFTMVVSYCFYMQTAGVFLTESSDYWNLFVSIKVLTEPIFALFFCLIAFAYTGLGIRYIASEMAKEPNQFLYYTFRGMPKGLRWRTWMLTMFLIQLPLFVYILYSLAVGYDQVGAQYGFLIIIFLVTINCGASMYIDRLSRKHHRPAKPKSMRQFSSIPLNLVLLMNHFHNNRIILMVTKILVLLTVYLFMYSSINHDARLLALLALILACFNGGLLYQDFVLQSQRMAFTLNFPYKTFRRFMEPIPYYILLISPEIILVIATSDNFFDFGLFAVFYLVFLLLFRSVILSIGNLPLQVSKALMLCFFTGLLFILYQAMILWIVLSLLAAILLFYKFFRYGKLRDNQNS